jgi:hypothetical protein
MTATGLMTPAGLAAVAAGRANGRWTALDHTETLAEPTDLAAALDANPAVRGRGTHSLARPAGPCPASAVASSSCRSARSKPCRRSLSQVIERQARKRALNCWLFSTPYRD